MYINNLVHQVTSLGWTFFKKCKLQDTMAFIILRNLMQTSAWFTPTLPSSHSHICYPPPPYPSFKIACPH